MKRSRFLQMFQALLFSVLLLAFAAPWLATPGSAQANVQPPAAQAVLSGVPLGTMPGAPDAGTLLSMLATPLLFMGNLEKLKQKRAAKLTEAKAHLDPILAEGRGLTAEEKAKQDQFDTELKGLDEAISAASALRERERTMAAEPNPAADQRVQVTQDEGDKQFSTAGHFFQAVIRQGLGMGMDPRLQGPRAAALGLAEGVGADGGFLVQTEYATELLQSGIQQSVLLPRCRQRPIGAAFDSVKLPYFKDNDRSGGAVYGGVQVYREAEAEAATATKPKLEMLELRLQKLVGLCYVTEELMADAVALQGWITDTFGTAFAFRVDDELLNGDGAGEMLGVLNAANAALITITKEAGQVADTVVFENVNKMLDRMPARLLPGAIWVVNQTCLKELRKMALAVGTGGVPVWMPANGVSGSPFSTLFGLPVIPHESAPVVGDAGDISLINFGQYMVIDKGGLQIAQSMHVQFLTGQNTLRFTMRNNGRPIWRTTHTPHKGDTVSPYVTLGARA